MDMANIPSGLKYTKTHEWIRQETDGALTVGITFHAQHLLGDVVYIELPVIDKVISQGAEAAVVESVKAASDIYSPVKGKITAVNTDLQTTPESVNQSPYTSGWIFRLTPDNADDIKALLNAEEYQHYIHTEA